MKATEQYFFVVLFITLYKAVLTFESGYNPKKRPLKWKLLSGTFLWSCSLCCAMWSVDEILASVSIQMKAIEKYFLGYGIMLYKVVLTSDSSMESQSYMTIQTKATELYFLVVRAFRWARWF